MIETVSNISVRCIKHVHYINLYSINYGVVHTRRKIRQTYVRQTALLWGNILSVNCFLCLKTINYRIVYRGGFENSIGIAFLFYYSARTHRVRPYLEWVVFRKKTQFHAGNAHVCALEKTCSLHFEHSTRFTMFGFYGTKT